MYTFTYSRSALFLALVAVSLAGCGQHSNDNYSNNAAPGSASTAAANNGMATDNTMAASGSTAGMGASSTPTNQSAATSGDFANKAATGGMAEVKFAELALSKTHNADVKTFAERMKRDHSAANAKLKSIAAGSSMQLPTDLTADQQQTMSMLQSKNGADFDKAYADAMVKDHEADVAEFQSATMNASTPQLRDFASQTLPSLKKHLQMAQALKSKMGG